MMAIMLSSVLLKPISRLEAAPPDSLYTIERKAGLLAQDNLGNLYLSEKGTLFKYNAQGKMQYRNNIKLFGSLNTLDVQNPLEVFLFFKETGVLVAFDNTLSKVWEFDLNRNNFSQTLAACNSMQDGFWIFDGNDFLLKRIDQNGNVLFQSENLFYLQEYVVDSVYLIEKGKRVFMFIADIEVLEFDIFATYVKKFSIKTKPPYYINNNDLFYTKNRKPYRFDKLLIKQLDIPLPEYSGNPDMIYTTRDKLYILDESKINVYSR